MAAVAFPRPGQPLLGPRGDLPCPSLPSTPPGPRSAGFGRLGLRLPAPEAPRGAFRLRVRGGVLAPLGTPAAPGSPAAAGRRFGVPRKAV